VSARTIARSLFVAAFVAVWSVVWISLAALVALVTWNRNAPLVMARRIWAPAIVRVMTARYGAEQVAPLDPKAPYVFVMNHQSMLDIACAFTSIPVNLRFVAKEVLKYVPFLGWYMILTGMIFVNRSSARKGVRSLARAADRIRAGSSILVFPEGTRSKDGRLLPFKSGPFVLALQAGVPIVPVAIEGSGRVLPSGKFRVEAGEVRLKIGAPIPTTGRPRTARDELMTEVRAALDALHREIGGAGAAPEAPTTPPGEEESAQSLAR
jgi:1-acyl-sn-glycerol-3-phosphate acyltransferase